MIGFWQLVILLVIVLLIFGPKRIEGLGSSLGKALKGFKKGMEDGESEEKKTVKKIENTDNKKES